MNPQLCDSNRLSSFVRGELDAEAERELTAHLDQCESCGQALEEQVAEASAWREANVFLGGQKSREQFPGPSVTQSRDAQIQQVLSQLSPTDDPDSLGRIGGYEVMGVIGSGGMGVVLKARDHSLDRVVAVKVMSPHLAASGSARQRFAREAKAAAAVLHPNVIAIHGVSNEQTLPFLVMPYVRGESLQKRIDDSGRLPLVDILRIGAQVAAGLAAAHEMGLVHRDIKPGNILLEQGVERVTITDFGLARAVDDASMTRSGVIAGTPQYMSPEQARGETIDARSDLFSLGSLLYAMCTGHSPFRAETSFGVMHRIMQDPPRRITEINSDIPIWLEGVVMKLLSKRAEDRFPSAEVVAELLEGCLSHTQQPGTVPLPASTLSLAAKPTRPRQWFRFLAAGCLIPLTLFAGILIVLELGKGTLRIESEVDDVPIRIIQGKDVVEQLTVSKSGKSVRIAAGNYQVEIGGRIDGLLLDDGMVTLRRGGDDVVRIVRDSGQANAKMNRQNASRVTTSSIRATHEQRQATARQTTLGNLLAIAKALHKYHESRGHFPPATIPGKQGTGGPPHSWRVELLPLLGYQELYDQYHFDEPWDSEHNKSLLPKMPTVYRSPRDEADSTNASYLGVVSDDVSARAAELQQMRDQRNGVLEPEYEQYTPEATVFWKQRGASFRDMLDGTSNCIAVIEAKRNIPWTRPADLEYSADQPLPEFGGWFQQGVHAAFADGSVRFLAATNDERTMRNLLTISDGQPAEPRLVRRLRIHAAVAVPETEPLITAGAETYQVPGGPRLRILSEQNSLFTEADLDQITATTDPNNPSSGEMLAITLTEEAGKRVLEATTKLSEQGKHAYLAVMFDGKVLSVPRVLTPIGRKLTLTGNLDAKTLARQIQAAMNEVAADGIDPSANANGTPPAAATRDAARLIESPVRGRIVRWRDGIHENARIEQGEFIVEITEEDPDKIRERNEQLSAARHQVESAQASMPVGETHLMATRNVVAAIESQQKAYQAAAKQIAAAANATIASAKDKIDATRATLAEHQAVLMQAQVEFARLEKLFEQKIISKQKFQEAEQKVKIAEARVTKAEAYVQEASNTLRARQNEQQEKERKALLDVQQSTAALNKARSDEAKAEGELAQTQLDLKRAERKVTELEAKLTTQSTTLIHAPVAGFVTRLTRNARVKEGDQVCLLWPASADAQLLGPMDGAAGFGGASDNMATLGRLATALPQIAETLRAAFALGQRFREIQARQRAAEQGGDSESSLHALEREKVKADLERETVVELLESQFNAARQRYQSQVTLRDAVKDQVKLGLLDPPSLPPAELAVVTTSAEIQTLEQLLEHHRSLGTEQVATAKDETELALVVLRIQLAAARKKLSFQADQSKLSQRRFEVGIGDTHEILKAEQAETTVAAQVQLLEALVRYYEKSRETDAETEGEVQPFEVKENGSTITAAQVQHNARSAVEAYLAAALAGDVTLASTLAKDSPANPKSIVEIPRLLNVQRLKVTSVYVNDPATPTKALATSAGVRLEEEPKQRDRVREGFMVFQLQCLDGQWFVMDIDFETESSADEELQRFLKANPKSIGLPPGRPAK